MRFEKKNKRIIKWIIKAYKNIANLDIRRFHWFSIQINRFNWFESGK